MFAFCEKTDNKCLYFSLFSFIGTNTILDISDLDICFGGIYFKASMQTNPETGVYTVLITL